MVIFQTPDGNPGYNQFDTIESAVAFVEQLRNDQGVSNARMFALEEIKFDFKPYYRVELAALTSGGPTAAPPPPAPATPLAGDIAASAPASPDPQAEPDQIEHAPLASAPDSIADLSSPIGVAPASEGEQQLRRGLFGR